MNRRHLFNLLIGAALAPKELIQPARSYFLPPRGGWFTESELKRLMRLVMECPSRPEYLIVSPAVWKAAASEIYHPDVLQNIVIDNTKVVPMEGLFRGHEIMYGGLGPKSFG